MAIERTPEEPPAAAKGARSFEELISPDTRSIGFVRLNANGSAARQITPDDLDGDLSAIERSLKPGVPEEIRKRIGVVRDLAVYAWFRYEFFTVAVFWSYSCIEMALWTKFVQLNPGPFLVTKKNKAQTVTWKQLESALRKRWRIQSRPEFDGSFNSLLQWATNECLLPQSILNPDAISRLRNSLAHPREFSSIVPPGWAVDAFALVVEIVNHLWPVLSA